MKTVMLVLVCACAQPAASHPRSVNVAAIRHEIQAVDDRPIISMGHADDTSAVVYTEQNGERREEMWQRGEAGWKLHDSKLIAQKP
jgi:hypothetical protein